MTYKEDLADLKQQINRLQQRGYGKPRWWEIWSAISGIVAVVALVVTIWTVYASHNRQDLQNDIKIEVGNQLAEPLRKISAMSDDMSGIKSKLDTLEPLIREMIDKRLRGVQHLPSERLSVELPKLGNLLQVAQKDGLVFDAEVVQKAGKRVVETANAANWNVALDFLSYRSFLNRNQTPEVSGPKPVYPPSPWFTEVQGTAIPGTTGHHTILIATHFVPGSQAARYQQIRAGKDVNADKAGPEQIIIDGEKQTILRLDDHWLKNVIIRNSMIIYESGPVELENVYFVNCTFVIPPNPNGRMLADRILDAPAITFAANKVG